MEVNAIVELINLVGFPIAACIALFWNNRETTKYQREMLDDFRVIITENTKAINRMIDHVEKGTK